MKLVTSEQMRLIDRESIDKHGIPGPELMENAGREIAERILSDLDPNDSNRKVIIFCGKGNNGGDGFVIARYLHQAGVSVDLFHLGESDELSPDAKLNYDRILEIGLSPIHLQSLSILPEQLESDLIIDAIFGTGFEGAPRGIASDLISYINRQSTAVIAVDIPSGLNADNGQHESPAVQADFTFTLAQPKYGLYLSPGRELSGIVTVLPIGIPDDVVNKFASGTSLITHEHVASLIPKRKPDGHKGDFGKLFLLAGSKGMTGAAVLAAKSALRSGAGLVKVGCPSEFLPIVGSSVIEATGRALPSVRGKGALALRGLGEIRGIVKDHDAIVIGPGIGQHHQTKELVRRMVSSLERPAILDADGLNAFAGKTDILKKASAPLVLTPHAGEFKRLTGDDSYPDSIDQRMEVAKSFAKEFQVTLVLKGSPTIVSDQSGACYINQTGNHGMATGGSGDVLSGIIGTLLAQGLSPFDAAVAGVFVHGMAGDFAAGERGARAMIAGDMIEQLGDVFILLEG